MANRLFRKDYNSFEIFPVHVYGKVSIAADATVSSDTLKNASVARTAAGTYTITLADAYPSLLSCNLTVLAATAVDLVPQIVSASVASSKTIVFKLLAAAVATDPSAACEVHVHIVLKNASV